MSLTARHLEAAGIATVIVGSARDIVEEAGVPRFVFTDFPLGNPFGGPGDAATQKAVLDLALTTAEQAFAPRTTVHAPFVWGDPDADTRHDWRDTFMLVSDENRAELAAEGDRRRARQAAAKEG